MFLIPLQVFAQGTQITDEEYWEATQLKFSHFEKDILPGCFKNATVFSSCMNALNVLAGKLDPQSRLMVDLQLKEKNSKYLSKAPEIVYPGLSLYFIDESKIKVDEIFQFSLNLKKMSANRIHELQKNEFHYHEILYSEILKAHQEEGFFLRILQILKLKWKSKANIHDEASVVGEMYNIYLMGAVDPHTHILPKELLLKEQEQGEVVKRRFGYSYDLVKDKSNHFRLKITEVLDNSPAMKAGIKWNDEIVSVNGHSIEELFRFELKKEKSDLDEENIMLGLERKQSSFSVTLKKESIIEKNVESKIINDFGIPTGYVKIRGFMSDDSARDVGIAVLTLLDKGVHSLVLDLRDNPGGSLLQGILISSIFIGKKVVFIQNILNPEDSLKLNQPMELSVKGKFDALIDLPMVTLVNSGSASASELVAGALQDHKRSWIVGERTYGKASEQKAEIFKGWNINNLSFFSPIVLYKTYARFLQPLGTTNQMVGIHPDFDVPLFPHASEASDAFREEDLFLNALPATDKRWMQSRGDEIMKINHCRMKGAPDKILKTEAEKIYDSKVDQEPVHSPDFRLLSAEEILFCSQKQ